MFWTKLASALEGLRIGATSQNHRKRMMRSNTGETVKPRTKEANLPAENDHSDKAVQPETSMLVEQVKRLPFRPEAQEVLEDEPRNPECYR